MRLCRCDQLIDADADAEVELYVGGHTKLAHSRHFSWRAWLVKDDVAAPACCTLAAQSDQRLERFFCHALGLAPSCTNYLGWRPASAAVPSFCVISDRLIIPRVHSAHHMLSKLPICNWRRILPKRLFLLSAAPGWPAGCGS